MFKASTFCIVGLLFCTVYDSLRGLCYDFNYTVYVCCIKAGYTYCVAAYYDLYAITVMYVLREVYVIRKLGLLCLRVVGVAAYTPFRILHNSGVSIHLSNKHTQKYNIEDAFTFRIAYVLTCLVFYMIVLRTCSAYDNIVCRIGSRLQCIPEWTYMDVTHLSMIMHHT